MAKMNPKIANIIKQAGGITLMASILWISLSVYNALKKPAEVEVEPSVIEPIQATLDTELLQRLGNREQLGERVDEILGQQINRPESTPTPAPTSNPTPSPDLSPSPNPSTESGGLDESGV